MSSLPKLAAAISIAATIFAAGSVLYAADSQNNPDSRMRDGMMGRGHGMMGPMSRMMSHCSAMMSSDGHRPNEQWRKPAPEEKD